MLTRLLLELVGPYSDEIRKTLGERTTRVERLRRLVTSSKEVEVEPRDLELLEAVLMLLLYEAIPVWEFHTLMGFWPREVDALRRGLRAIRREVAT